MENYFTLSECCIDKSKDIPQDIADKLLKYHIVPMNKVREKLGKPVWPSQDSGWRPLEWELSRGRSGKSQHTFQGKGAIDWTAEDLGELFELILRYTDYKRIAVYPDAHFIHCDMNSNDRQLFLSTNNSVWTRTNAETILSKI